MGFPSKILALDSQIAQWFKNSTHSNQAGEINHQNPEKKHIFSADVCRVLIMHPWKSTPSLTAWMMLMV
jgi:hypothetical protein